MNIEPNDPTEWGKVWTTIASTGMACWPTDGRETIWDPYETIVKTDNVGDYLDAYSAVLGGEHVRRYEQMPEDMLAYLQQRVPSMLVLEGMNPDTKINRFGIVKPK